MCGFPLGSKDYLLLLLLKCCLLVCGCFFDALFEEFGLKEVRETDVLFFHFLGCFGGMLLCINSKSSVKKHEI